MRKKVVFFTKMISEARRTKDTQVKKYKELIGGTTFATAELMEEEAKQPAQVFKYKK